MTPENPRFQPDRERIAYWKRWKPYLSERQLGTYKYPQQAFPYAQLIIENCRGEKFDPEFELLDTGGLVATMISQNAEQGQGENGGNA